MTTTESCQEFINRKMYFRFMKQPFGVATISNKLYLKLVNLGYRECLIVAIGRV